MTSLYLIQRSQCFIVKRAKEPISINSIRLHPSIEKTFLDGFTIIFGIESGVGLVWQLPAGDATDSVLIFSLLCILECCDFIVLIYMLSNLESIHLNF